MLLLVGYYYYLLMLQYGPVPIVPETPFNVDVPVAEMSLERGTYDECVLEIRKWMSLAIQFLPLEVESSTVVTLPTQWAAYATLSRITLYAASPWYNGNKFYADWQRTSDGANFISQEMIIRNGECLPLIQNTLLIQINLSCIGLPKK